MESIDKKPSITLIAYSEAFIAALPFFVVRGVFLLLSESSNISELKSISRGFDLLFPFVILLSITFQLAKRHHIPQITAVSLSLSILVVHQFILIGTFNPEYLLSADTALMILIIPFLVTKGLIFITPRKIYFESNSELNNSIRHIYSAPAVFLIVSALLALVTIVLNVRLTNLGQNLLISNDALMLIKILLDHLLWFVGMHGGAISNSFFGTGFLVEQMFDAINYKLFYELFVVFGGAGAGLSLLLAVYIAGKDRHTLRVARLATPLVIFNINEILIFGIPIFFNKKLLLPFILAPLMNFTVSYLFLSFYSIEIVREVGWMMPYFINGYVATGGDLIIPFFQLILLIISTCIYIPFIKSHSSAQSFHLQSENLANNLDIKPYLDSNREIKSHKALVEIMQSNHKTEEIIRLMSNDNLMVYYQPKVDVLSNDCKQHEALLRIQMPDGKIREPFFLDQIEIAGQASIIDIWVCQQVSIDMQRWMKKGQKFKISINLHPDTLADNSAISQITSILSGKDIDFEIVERGLLDTKSAIENISHLKRQGFSITVDDFGTGYSSFEILCSLPISALKIDRSLIKWINTSSGFITCKHIANLCADMQLSCIAEGVETEEQYQLVTSLNNITHIQGFYYSAAVPVHKVGMFRPHSYDRIVKIR